MFGAAVVGGLILAMIEGISLGISRVSGQMELSGQSKLFYLYLEDYYFFLFNNTSF